MLTVYSVCSLHPSLEAVAALSVLLWNTAVAVEVSVKGRDIVLLCALWTNTKCTFCYGWQLSCILPLEIRADL